MAEPLLKTISEADLRGARRDPVDDETLSVARRIVEDVRARGEAAVREHAERLGDVDPGAPLVLRRADLASALAAVAPADAKLLGRTAERIRRFAAAQRDCLLELSMAIPGGCAGHRIAPVARAGCYAPGGRFPLPSSALMTAVTARAAGVEEVWLASPRPAAITLAAAAVAGADGFLLAGGAQGIAALAFGAGPVPACDVVVGPGNRFVTAAKQLVSGRVAIDMLAGPSELAILADAAADPELVAADLLAQAEHDPDALPVLVTWERALIGEVNRALEAQLRDLATQETARRALAAGFAVLVPDLDAAVRVVDALAPEHLELQVAGADAVALRCRHYGALFVGAAAAEVLGDYGAGPNHTLPTGGTARSFGGLSVLDFLRVRTFLAVNDPGGAAELAADAECLARLEGLFAHARAARLRRLAD